MSTREAVLAALRAAPDGGVSGETLAGTLGVSRTAVGKHVAALRALGYDIEARAGEGYRLLGVPDLPIPSEVAPLVSDPFWVDIEGAEETGSTNDDARALARAGALEGSAVVAARQRSGRGRLGRSWASPEGGAYVSVILRPPVAAAEVSSIALAIALGVAYGLESLGAEPRLKWPNDVRFGSDKVAGVLLEMAAESDRVEWVVAGVGLNVRAPGAPGTETRKPRTEPREPGAAYLADEVPGVRVAAATAAVLDGIARAYREWLRGGFRSLITEFEARHALTGAEVTVRDLDGSVRAAGRVVGVDQQGRLLVAEEGVVEAVSAGEVTLRAPE